MTTPDRAFNAALWTITQALAAHGVKVAPVPGTNFAVYTAGPTATDAGSLDTRRLAAVNLTTFRIEWHHPCTPTQHRLIAAHAELAYNFEPNNVTTD